jgi:predicted metalloprotease
MAPARIGGPTGLGIGGILLVLAISYFTGTNPLTILNMLNGVQRMTEVPGPSESGQVGAPADQLGKFTAVVLADTDTPWRERLG